MDHAADPVCCLREEDGYVWLPRYYDRDLWDCIESWEWTEGREFDFGAIIDPVTLMAALDPERGQDAAVPAMIAYIRQHNGGILIAPTGTGKTHMGLTIAATFGRKIGIPVYAGHMIDNWTDHAKSVLGLRSDQIGLVQGERCDLGKPVTIMMIQTLLSRGVPSELAEQIGFLILDETQHYGARKWKETVGLFPARYRLALSADPSRNDGLDEVVAWSVGSVGYRAKRIRTKKAKPPTCVMIRWDYDYPYTKYCRWKKIAGQWRAGDPDSMKYDKVIAKDKQRTQMFAREICNALKKDRAILVLSRFCDHRDELHALVSCDTTKTTALFGGGLSKEARSEVAKADAIFATYSMARDALNIPRLDTLVFATPPGDLTQPAGRLREKAEGIERKQLMIVDSYELADFSKRKASRRRDDYRQLGIPVTEVRRAR
jgi:superfamily II DNA or RNA helicase